MIRISSRIAIIHAGRLAALGTVGELKDVFEGRPILEVRAAQPVRAMEALDGMPDVEKTSIFGTAVHAVLRSASADPARVGWRLPDGGLLGVSLPYARDGSRLHDAGITGATWAVVEPSLEDVFLDVAERAG